jgi:hypothetical protein
MTDAEKLRIALVFIKELAARANCCTGNPYDWDERSAGYDDGVTSCAEDAQDCLNEIGEK